MLNQATVLQLLKLLVEIVWDLLLRKSTFVQSVEYKRLCPKNLFLLAASVQSTYLFLSRLFSLQSLSFPFSSLPLGLSFLACISIQSPVGVFHSLLGLSHRLLSASHHQGRQRGGGTEEETDRNCFNTSQKGPAAQKGPNVMASEIKSSSSKPCQISLEMLEIWKRSAQLKSSFPA